jgi:hypothetical protein
MCFPWGLEEVPHAEDRGIPNRSSRIALQKATPEALPWIERNFEGKLPFEAIPLEGNLYTPEAVPLLLL